MKMFFTADSDIKLLSFFLEHYRKLGFTEFFCCTNNWFVENHKVTVFNWFQSEPSYFGSWDAAFNRMIHNTVSDNEWYGVAELDEFAEYDRDIFDVVKDCQATRKSHVLGILKDRVASDGGLPKLDLNVPLHVQFPSTSEISTKILKACDQKVILVKGKRNISVGKHSLIGDSECFKQKYLVWHFKWHENVLQRMADKITHSSDDGTGWIEGNKRVLDYWNKHRSVIC